MKKLLITGSSGFLGSRLALYYKDKYELLLPTHSELNVSREEAVMAYMEQFQPDIVLHCAALSNTWYCEQHSDESHRVNVQGTVKIQRLASILEPNWFLCPATKYITELLSQDLLKNRMYFSLSTYMVGTSLRLSKEHYETILCL